MNPILHHLKSKGLVWQGAFPCARQAPATMMAGDLLADHLPGGLACHPVVEIDSPMGIGELRLLLPNLQANAADNSKLLVWIASPYKPNAEALHRTGLDLSRLLLIHPEVQEEALWAAEQCLKSGACHSVLLWYGDLSIPQLQRLQQAAKQGQAQLFFLRTAKSLSLSLPVSLSIRLYPQPEGLQVEVRKSRGYWPPPPFLLHMDKLWPQLCLASPPPNDHKLIPFPGSRAS